MIDKKSVDLVVRALRDLLEAEEQSAFWNHWPLADIPRPVALTDRNRAPMDREWRHADPDGFRRYQRGKAALHFYEVRS